MAVADLREHLLVETPTDAVNDDPAFRFRFRKCDRHSDLAGDQCTRFWRARGAIGLLFAGRSNVALSLPSHLMSNEPNKIIYSMIGVTKRYDKKVVLKDIYLSYFYGAKIGVLGLNGSGKSSLLKILAGVDKNVEGQISLAPGF